MQNQQHIRKAELQVRQRLLKKPQAAQTNAKQTRSTTHIPKTTHRKENVIKTKGKIEEKLGHKVHKSIPFLSLSQPASSSSSAQPASKTKHATKQTTHQEGGASSSSTPAPKTNPVKKQTTHQEGGASSSKKLL